MIAVLHPSAPSLTRLHASLLADTVNDPDSTRKVYLLAGGLAALGLALIIMTVWFWRNTRHDPELLGPLEAMGSRKFARLDSRTQQQILDEARPRDAQPLRTVPGAAARAEPIDLKVGPRSTATGFDDLLDDLAPERSARPVPAADAATTVRAAGPTTAPPADDVAATSAPAADVASSSAGGDVEVGFADDVVVDEGPNGGVDDDGDWQPRSRDPEPETPADPTAETELDEFAVIDALTLRRDPATPATGAAAIDAGPIPLVIVPMDHDLPGMAPGARRVPARSAGDPNGRPADDDGRPANDDDVRPADDGSSTSNVDAEPEVDASSIDPLLRPRDR